MKIIINSVSLPDAECLIFPVNQNSEIDLPIKESALISEAAKLARFKGEAGSIFETFAAHDGMTRRIVLVGVGDASPEHCEKAGAAVSARLLTSGVGRASVDGGTLSPQALARLGLGALLRSWRIDTYRTKQAETAKPTLNELVLVSEDGALPEIWAPLEAVAQGVALTRELVAEPANVIYPESFVESVSPPRCVGRGVYCARRKRHGEAWHGRVARPSRKALRGSRACSACAGMDQTARKRSRSRLWGRGSPSTPAAYH